MSDVVALYVRRLTRRPNAVRTASRALAGEFDASLSRRVRLAAACDAVATASSLLPAALARHAARRAGGVAAAAAVLSKFGRDADLDASAIGVVAAWRSPRLNPRLGGLLGSDGTRLAGRLAERSQAPVVLLARAVAACAPFVLGAIAASAPTAPALAELLVALPGDLLDPAAPFPPRESPAGRVFAAVHRSAAGAWGLWRMFWFR